MSLMGSVGTQDQLPKKKGRIEMAHYIPFLHLSRKVIAKQFLKNTAKGTSHFSQQIFKDLKEIHQQR